MKKKRYSVEQITAILKEAEAGTPVGNVCRQLGIAEQTFYRWKKATAECCPAKRASSSSCAKRTRASPAPSEQRSTRFMPINTGPNLSPKLSPVPENVSPEIARPTRLDRGVSEVNGSGQPPFSERPETWRPGGHREFASGSAAYTYSSCGEVAERLKAAVC